ncbi:MAG: hypothetical protein JWQ70_2114 [Aeromicrobium sp.]|nr:hypothetical protein [Aeromicrobium sp.]
MRQAGSVTTYSERLTAPISWWLAACGFAAVWGWILLVVTTWAVAIAVTVVVAALTLTVVSRFGSLHISVGDDGLRVGQALLDRPHIGNVEMLNRAAYRMRMGTGADARAYLVTRPYLDRGVLVSVDDDRDPTPYWLISSRRPEALAAALGHTGHAPEPSANQTIRETPDVEEG